MLQNTCNFFKWYMSHDIKVLCKKLCTQYIGGTTYRIVDQHWMQKIFAWNQQLSFCKQTLTIAFSHKLCFFLYSSNLQQPFKTTDMILSFQSFIIFVAVKSKKISHHYNFIIYYGEQLFRTLWLIYIWCLEKKNERKNKLRDELYWLFL